MRNRRNTVGGLLAGALLAAVVLAGCRAFEPEVVIVNKAPETYIVGAPVEHGGGYFHFHVFWYGSDADGRVERFVWALTDTTVQDPLTSDDEEDTRFNPALNASTLEIGHWTTRTDSVFDFKIEQGTNISADLTLHMVAVDDFGDFDRTPARLHFFSNTLGTPVIQFFRVEPPGLTPPGQDSVLVPIAVGEADTIGFGRPYEVAWTGVTPNIYNYDPAMLAKVDTVYPFDDGLFGYKWMLRGSLGGDCVPSQRDCWSPRRFSPATGDSFSYFGDVQGKIFWNGTDPDGPEPADPFGTNPFKKLLSSGAVNLDVNSIDVAGVEVVNYRREFTFVANRDPQTAVLDSAAHTNDPNGDDTQIYPYYVRLEDPLVKVPFGSGAHIPDRTYVVVKALGRDDAEDVILDPGYGIGLEGFVQGTRFHLDGARFRIQTEASPLNTDLGDPDPGGWYADTLGFIVGPRTTYTFNMTAVDEHGRRDGTPAQFSFHVGEPPCVQCIEVLPKSFLPSNFPDPDLACSPDPGNACLDGSVAAMDITLNGPGAADLEFVRPAFFAVEKSTEYVSLVDDVSDLAVSHYWVDARVYKMTVLLHGQDDALERWADLRDRIMAWRYQVDYECDPDNEIKDGGGVDDISRITSGEGPGLTIDAATGLWKLTVEVGVPTLLFNFPPDQFWLFVNTLVTEGQEHLTDALYWGSIRQLGDGMVSAVALDQTNCAAQPQGRPAAYNYFKNVRPTVPTPPDTYTWRSCALPGTLVPGLARKLDLGPVAMESNAPAPDHDWTQDPNGNPWTNLNGGPVRGVAVAKDFRVVLQGPSGPVDCHTPPTPPK